MIISLLRYLLFPFSILYGCIIWVRNRLYDFHFLSSKSFSIPTIVIGNLAVGGTGKSPMTEFIAFHLQNNYKIAILSRGYGRNTKGFLIVEKDSSAMAVGDEPLQFKNKFPQLTVAVSEDRCTGIDKLKNDHQIIILDDAYQHRKLSPLVNILLFDFQSFAKPMFVFPSGNFRDLLIEAKRAHIIAVTKCPANISIADQKLIEKKLRRYNKKAIIIFSSIDYLHPINSIGDQVDLNDKDIILVTGIAKPQPLVDYIEKKAKSIIHLSFGDHHSFTSSDMEYILKTYHASASSNKILLTTEKDFQRLKPFKDLLTHVNLVYLPIGLQFHNEVQKDLFLNVLNKAIESPNVNQH